MTEPCKIRAACRLLTHTLGGPRPSIRPPGGRADRKKAGVGNPAPASLRVASPRQGDFAKPDCGNEGERPASRLLC